MAALLLLTAAYLCYPSTWKGPAGHVALKELEAPEDPHWDGDTGVALWKNVPNSGSNGEVGYHWRLYRENTNTLPDLSRTVWVQSGSMRGNVDVAIPHWIGME